MDKKVLANTNETINSAIALTMCRNNDTETKEFLKSLGLPEDADEDVALNALIFSTAHHIQNISIRKETLLKQMYGCFALSLNYYKAKCKANGVDDRLKEDKENGEANNAN